MIRHSFRPCGVSVGITGGARGGVAVGGAVDVGLGGLVRGRVWVVHRAC